jgi:guanine deaminase
MAMPDLPGFIDTHVHYPQTQVIGATAQLVDWLDNVFIAEQQFASPAWREVAGVPARMHARGHHRHGVLHRLSAVGRCVEAEKINARMIAALLMDRRPPRCSTRPSPATISPRPC